MEQMNPYQAPGADVAAIPAQDGFDQSSVFSTNGRFGRLSYLAWGVGFPVLLLMIIGIVAALVAASVGAGTAANSQSGLAAMGALGIVWVAVFVVGLVVAGIAAIIFAIRRAHDMDMSGWWVLLFFVPLVNLIFTLLFMLKAGSEGVNRFGPPRVTRGWEKVVGIIAAILVAVQAVINFSMYLRTGMIH